MAVIDRDRWRELGPLLDRALELEDDERAAWLGELHVSSPELAAELAALLAADAVADRRGFLEGAVDAEAPGAFARVELGAYLQSALGGAYAVERELGGGGMSRVFVAQERALGRTVVIKVLPPALAASMSAERFKREILFAAQLQHPNIVPVFSVGELEGVPFYTMPFVEGESLRARLARGGPLPAAKAVSSSARPAAEPGAGAATLSAVGSTIGTPAYIAPEQAAGDPRVDHRADLYAWGLLAYELLAGTHPFAHRTTAQQLFAAHLSEAPPPLPQRAPELPPALTALVMRCLEKDRDRRPRGAREILDGLATIPTPPAGAAHLRSWVRARVRRAVMVRAGLLAVALTAYLATVHRLDRSAGRAPAGVPSLAVLPFEAVGGDTASAYFGDGIADEIAAALSKAGGLRVASRTSVAAFRASHHDVGVRELGRRLGVSTVLEGRVRRSGDRMRLTVQLASVADGLTLWSDAYERQVKDVFRVQDEIARSVAGALRARLPGAVGPQPGRPVSSPGTANLEAYDLYLRGSYLLERRGSGVAKAVEYFERASAEDSTFARAYAGLAYALALMPTFGGTPRRTIERRATDAARRALAVDPTLAEAYTALGLLHESALRWWEAGEAFRRAVAADPGFAPGQYHYGHYLMRVGRLADAEEPCRRARIADPLSGTASLMLAYTLSLLGRSDESLAESRRAYELDSSLASVQAYVPLVVLAAGRPGEARTLARVALPMPFKGIAAYVLGATGDRARAAAIARELEARPPGDWLVATTLTYAYLGLGDTARALSAMEATARAGGGTHVPLADPMFDPLRRSERFAAAVRRFGLDERLFTSPAARRR